MRELGTGTLHRDRQAIHWEQWGDPDGRPALALHGGPGSGLSRGWLDWFDGLGYRVVLLDQRGCGASRPDAGDPATDLSANTTSEMIADLEALRERAGCPRWLVLGGSWGSTLGLAYAEAHPERVSALVLFSVVTATAGEVRWLTRDMGRLLPEAWARFRAGAGQDADDDELAAAYARRLADPDAAVRERAADDWCAWEDAHVRAGTGAGPDPRYADPVFRMRFARLVTHYFAHAAFLEDGQLLRDADRLAGIPGALIHGTDDVSSPPDVPWQLARRWPDATLTLVAGEGHGAGQVGIAAAIRESLRRFAGE